MEGNESKSLALQEQSPIGPEMSARFAENTEGFQQCVKEVLEAIEQDQSFSEMTAADYDQKKSYLTENLQELSRMHRLLADQHSHLLREVTKNCPSLIERLHPGSSDLSSHQVAQMLKPNQVRYTQSFMKPSNYVSLFLPDRCGFYLSEKEGSSDSGSEPFKFINMLPASSVNDDALKVKETNASENLFEKISSLEEEVVNLNEILRSLREENAELKQEIKEIVSDISLYMTESNKKIKKTEYELEECKEHNNNINHLVAGVLQQKAADEVMHEGQIRELNKQISEYLIVITELKSKTEAREKVRNAVINSLNIKLQNLEEENTKLKHDLQENESDIETQTIYLETEKTKATELQKQVADLKLVISGSNLKVKSIEDELETSREKLLSAEDEISKLKHELSSKISKLGSTQQEMALLQKQLDTEKESKLVLKDEVSICVADISMRDEEIIELKTKISQFMSEISLLKSAQEANEVIWNADIEKLKLELREKCRSVDYLTKNLDSLNLKKDGFTAQLDTLLAEKHSQDILFSELETHLNSLQVEYAGVLSSFDNAQKLSNELRLKVLDLEREVDRQREVITDRAEEKREAIRQLSFSLEHYMSGYKELRQAFIGNKRHAVLTSYIHRICNGSTGG